MKTKVESMCMFCGARGPKDGPKTHKADCPVKKEKELEPTIERKDLVSSVKEALMAVVNGTDGWMEESIEARAGAASAYIGVLKAYAPAEGRGMEFLVSVRGLKRKED
jgi:hypothetical protein